MICSGRYAEVAKEASMLCSLKGGGGALAIGFIFGSGGITVDGGDLAPVMLVEGEVVNAEVVPTAPHGAAIANHWGRRSQRRRGCRCRGHTATAATATSAIEAAICCCRVAVDVKVR